MKIILYKILSLFFLGLNLYTVYSQSNTIDSLTNALKLHKEDTNKIKTLNALSWSVLATDDYKKALQYANEAFSLSEKVNFVRGKADSHFNIAWAFLIQSGYSKAMEYATSALNLYQQINDKTGIAESYHVLGQINHGLGNSGEASKNYYSALRIREALGDKKGIARSYQLIGAVNETEGNNFEALQNYEAVLRIHKELDNKFGVALAYNSIGGIYLLKGNYEYALKNFSSALNIYKELNLDWGISSAYNSIGVVYEEQGKVVSKTVASKQLFTEALKYYSLALKITERGEDKRDLGVYLMNFGSVYIKLNKLQQAKVFLDSSLQLLKAVENKEMIRENYRLLLHLDSIQKNYRGAYENYKMYILYRDSLNNEENTKKIVQSKMQYDFDKKETIAQAKQEKKDAEQRR